MDETENLDLLSAFIDTFDSDLEDDSTVTSPRSSDGDLPVANVGTTPAQTDPPPSDAAIKKQTSAARILEECDIFASANNDRKTREQELFGDESDDADDELSTKTNLNENGADIRRLMKDREQQSVQSTGFYDRKVTTSQIKNKWSSGSRIAHDIGDSKAVRIPDLGLSILNPKVSMEFLKQSMSSKELVILPRIAHRNANTKNPGDWITFGVITSKTETKRSAAGNAYIIMRLVDMNNVDEEVSLFLFGKCYDAHWKLPVGTTVGLMNPSIMKNDKTNSRCTATINVHNESQVLVIGTSKDFGTCGSITKGGNKCTNVVNMSACDKCRFHTMQEHKTRRQGRTELNAAFSSKEPTTVGSRLLSKLATTKYANDCFTYGGKSFSTKPQKPKTKVSLNGVLGKSAEKGNLQSTLSLYHIKAEDQKRISAAATAKRSKAEEKLEELISKPTTASMQFMKHLVSKELKAATGAVTNDGGITVASVKPSELIRHEKLKFNKQLKERKAEHSLVGGNRAGVELGSINAKPGATTMTASDYRKLMAKQKAKEVLKNSGGLQKEDANAIRKKLSSKQKEQVKRRFDDSLNSSNSHPDSDPETEKDSEKRKKLKKLDVNSEAYLEIRNKKSINSHLVKQVEADRESQYFGTLEKKESYETKLLGTHTIEAKIYYCIQCDYQDWSLAKRCFDEGHKYKKLPTLKRFFKCNNCKERVVTHEKYPTGGCKKCGSSNYGKAGMIHEKKVLLAGQEMSLRGNEESKLGSYDSTVNLDIV